MEYSRSYSMYASLNGKNAVQVDDNGTPCEGVRFGEDRITIMRFHNGLLDGDVYDENGNVIDVKPAIEKKGHIEYWRKGKLHHDDGLPAVISQGFTVREWWIDGTRQPDPVKQ